MPERERAVHIIILTPGQGGIRKIEQVINIGETTDPNDEKGDKVERPANGKKEVGWEIPY